MKTIEQMDEELFDLVHDDDGETAWPEDVLRKQRNNLHNSLQHTLYLLRNIIDLPSLETYAHYPQFQQAREWLERMAHE